jgi:hypothetical protein
MARYVILNALNQIVNRCEWDGVSNWSPPVGFTAIPESEAAGFEDEPRPVPVPQSITAAQLRVALRRAGQITAFVSAVQGLGAELQDMWQYAKEIRRNGPAVKAIQAAMGLSDNQVDSFFTAAAAIEI